jgi:hypothetical protein
LEPLPSLSAYVPDETDFVAHQIAVAAWAPDPTALDAAVAQVAVLDAARNEAGAAPTGLLPYALDVRNAVRDDDLVYQRASHELLERDDVDPALRARLEQEADDDPIGLAQDRLGDARRARFARIFNALVEPLGRTLTTGLTSGVMLPLQLARTVTGIAVREHMAPELSTPERQALDHWRRFIEEHYDSAEAAALIERVEEDQRRWYRTQRDRSLRRARRALDAGQAQAALVLAERAMRYSPEDPAATQLRDEARARVEEERALSAASLQSAPDADVRGGRALALALLSEGPEGIQVQADRLLETDPEGPLADEAEYALALTLAETGQEDAAWQAFEELAKHADPRMARHAWAILAGPDNPERLFRRARSQERGLQLRWLALGPLAGGVRRRNLPRSAEWVLELPTLFDVGVGLPNRLIRFPWNKPKSTVPAIYAHSYLERFPQGAHAAELRDWLVDYEGGHGNWIAALGLAEQDPAADPDDIAELRERAARQALDTTARVQRQDLRLALLRQAAREYEGTEAGAEARETARLLIQEATPQRIRISRGFLRENPTVAGPEGLALRPELLDDDLSNGELHPNGVSLLGGLVLELNFVNERGKERGEPLTRRQTVSEERLARVVALLEEATFRNARLDPDLTFVPDADRDLYFERARLGVTDTLDTRATAQSTYTFLSARERFGMVRSRDSILPVELVLQVSGTDFGFGAFPRIRLPQPTPDAVLYE